MSKDRRKSIATIILENMGWPVFWGVILTVGFYSLLRTGIVENQLLERYFASHPVQYFETALFLTGVSAIFMKAMHVIGQFGTMAEIDVMHKPAGGQAVSDAAGMLESLAKLPGYVRKSYLARRLEQALEFVARKGTASGLDAELKHLSDMDAARQHEGFALVRIIIWATPMLGFLGTVIGITLALADLSPQALVSTPESAMEGLLAGLAVAFDTTALALVLAIVLMFAQFLTGRLETELLEAVDRRVDAELVGRFQQLGTDTDPHLQSIEQMSVRVVETVEGLMTKQAELWVDSVVEAQEAWNGTAAIAGAELEKSMEAALRDSMQDHSQTISAEQGAAVRRLEQHWEKLESVLSQNAHVMQQQQSELVRQGDMLLKTVQGIGDISQLQDALNSNLASLSIAAKLDETIISLSGAINLLNGRLAPTDSAKQIRLFAERQQRGEAA